MVEISDDEFDLDALMVRIREEVDRRRAQTGAAATPAGPGAVPGARGGGGALGAVPAFKLLRVAEDAVSIDTAATYRAVDFLRYHDEAFLRCVYRAILRRPPDGAGLTSFLEAIRCGSKSRIEVLGRIRYSPEGRAVGTPVRGLALRFAVASIRRVPIIGGILASIETLARFPRLAAAHEQFEAAYFRRDWEIRRQLDVNAAAIEQQMNAIGIGVSEKYAITRDDLVRTGTRIESIENALARLHVDVADLHIAISKKADGAALESLTEAVQAKADSADLERTAASVDAKAGKAEIDAISNRLGSLAADAAAIGERVATVWPLSVQSSDADRHGSLYLDLENRFRGSRDDIAKRVEIYLPIVRSAGAGTAALPVLDVGCGRGEWLEVIARDGLVGYGVDIRESMVAEASSRHVRVELGEALEHLRLLRTSSLGAVTAFHVVEHLPFDVLLHVIDEALRVLTIGGVLIMETPNPENLVVGSHTFYVDPTHLRPIPPALLHFAAEHAGFAEIETLRLHPRPESDRLIGSDPAALAALNRLLFGPQDYAIVARKPAGGPADGAAPN